MKSLIVSLYCFVAVVLLSSLLFAQDEEEKVIKQKMRKETFDNFQTTDDHHMHLTGIAENQVGTKFYYIKTSGAQNIRMMVIGICRNRL